MMLCRPLLYEERCLRPVWCVELGIVPLRPLRGEWAADYAEDDDVSTYIGQLSNHHIKPKTNG